MVMRRHAFLRGRRIGACCRRYCHADLHLGPSNPDGSDEELHLVLLPCKDMLDSGPDPGSSPVCPRHCFRHGLALRLSLVDVRLQAVVSEPFLDGLRSVGAVGPDRRGGVVLGHDISELGTVMGARTRHRPTPDEAMRTVDARVICVTEHRNGDVMGLRWR